MNQVEISFAWPAPDNVSRFKFPEETAAMLKRAVDGVLRDAEVEAAEVSVTLLGDEGIEDLNRRYLGHEGPTDVISFSLPGPGGGVVGDVYIGVEQAFRQMEGPPSRSASLTEELVRLAIHGTLHVLGHEHPEGEDRHTCEMFILQERLVQALLA